MPLMESILVANRGEIARRVMRTARRLGIRTIAVYSDADIGAAHVRDADSAVRIGAPPARESYLAIDQIIDAALTSDAKAIHPGYGFLAESADFAERVLATGLVWIGPPASAIRAMGLKDAAKRLMQDAGVPVTPGYLGEDQSVQRLTHEAEAIGWPVLIKAVAGGGGKGMRRVDRREDFAAALAGAKREGAASFGDDRVLLEKYVTHPRHIEVQIFGDRQGRVVHLFERDCSLQRRHQKVIEEAPAPGMDEATRAGVCEAAVRAGEAVSYEGAGTIEFIADASEGLRADRIWFMEMNTRLQVEHPVTEAITGIDLVEWQLRVASGQALPLRQDQIARSGHAMEARLYAEDPSAGFLPSIGPLTHLKLPEAVRVDTGVEAGDAVSAYYDPMLAKVIVHADTRTRAAEALANACGTIQVWPIKTNAAFLARCAADPDFQSGLVDTAFIAQRLEELSARPVPVVPPGIVAALTYPQRTPGTPWSPVRGATGFRLNGAQATTAHVFIDGVGADLPFDFSGHMATVCRDDRDLVFFSAGAAFRLSLSADHGPAGSAVSDGGIRAPMPGRVVQVLAAAGDRVRPGQTLAVLEAMKMEHALVSPFEGLVAELTVREGDQVTEGALLGRVAPTS